MYVQMLKGGFHLCKNTKLESITVHIVIHKVINIKGESTKSDPLGYGKQIVLSIEMPFEFQFMFGSKADAQV